MEELQNLISQDLQYGKLGEIPESFFSENLDIDLFREKIGFFEWRRWCLDNNPIAVTSQEETEIFQTRGSFYFTEVWMEKSKADQFNEAFCNVSF
jgi:hypothetical protein